MPGLCVPVDGCVPGDEEATCGEPATCLPTAWGSFCLPAGLGGEGDPCAPTVDAPEGNCAGGLVCGYGTCAPACDEACDAGSCLRSAGAPFGVCHVGCELGARCDEGRVCVPVDFTPQAGIIAACRRADAGDGIHGEACETREGAGDWGTCTPAHRCARSVVDRELRCRAICAPGDACPGTSACVRETSGEHGVCTGTCDVFTGDGCGADERCAFTGFFGHRPDGEVPIGRCVAGAEGEPAGAACQGREGQGADCAAGLVCVRDPRDGIPTCRAFCGPDRPCGDGFECDTARSRSDRIGYCQPAE